MDKKLIIIGAGEFAEIAYEYFTFDSDYTVTAFSVEKDFLLKEKLRDLDIVPFERLEDLYPPDKFETFVAIPASQLNRLRTRLFEEVKSKGYNCASYVSSSAFVWRNVKLGENCFIFENNTVQPFVEIGDNVVMWSGNHIGHRTVIESNVFLSSHVVISGYCRVGESSFLGVNSTLNDHSTVPKDSIIASMALVNKKLSDEGKVYIGNPAKAHPRLESLKVKL